MSLRPVKYGFHESCSFLRPGSGPREKLLKYGVSILKNEELLAILLGAGVKNKNVFSIARDILKEYNLQQLADTDLAILRKLQGVGLAKSSVILAALELGRRLFQKESELVMLDSPSKVYEITKNLSQHKKEYFEGLYLNTKNQLIHRETICIGSLFSNIVHPREVFTPAIAASAAGVILAHNHPSGDPEPSPEDRILTQRLIEAGQLLGIEVLDHLVIGKDSYISFQERNLLL